MAKYYRMNTILRKYLTPRLDQVRRFVLYTSSSFRTDQFISHVYRINTDSVSQYSTPGLLKFTSGRGKKNGWLTVACDNLDFNFDNGYSESTWRPATWDADDEAEIKQSASRSGPAHHVHLPCLLSLLILTSFSSYNLKLYALLTFSLYTMIFL